MNVTIKKFLLLVFSLFLLAILIFYDPRSSIIVEQTPDIYHAISIAISYLIYDMDGFQGLNEVYKIFEKIPPATNYYSRHYSILGGFILDFENINEVKEYYNIKLFCCQDAS